MRYDVPLIPQSTPDSCWAASIAMILGWRDKASYSDVALARNVGGIDYSPSLKTGLDPNDRYILERNGFALEAPQCYTEQAIRSLLQHRGPLWVASAIPSPHIRVVTGISGHQLNINDPWAPGVGAQYIRSFTDFFGQMEQLGGKELAEKAPVYVAYLRR